MLISELDQISQRGVIEQFISGTAYDEAFRTMPPYTVPWADREAALHHWAALENRTTEIASMSVADALATVSDWIDTAETIRSEAGMLGVEFEPPSGDHLAMWKRAIQQFRDMTELS